MKEMYKAEKYMDEDIEIALRLICDPGQVLSPEAEEWLKDNDHRNLLEELRRYREAGIELPDADQEWKTFRSQHFVARQSFRWGWVSGAVAVIAILFMFTWMYLRPEGEKREFRYVHLAEGELSEVTVITNEGEKVLAVPGILQLNEEARVDEILSDSIRGVNYLNVSKDSNSCKEHHTLRVPRHKEYFLQLEDGSKVWLNEETELRYPIAFGRECREVELLKGEAYFEVNRDEKRPFVVKTTRITTRVLGTEFNVQSYSGKPTNITLVKGAVSVRANDAGADEVILKPGENALLMGDDLIVREVDVMTYTAWKDGYFYYKNVRLEEILDGLGRWFGFSVFYQNQAVKDYRFEFWANRKELPEKIVERLNEIGRLEVRWNEGHVVVAE